MVGSHEAAFAADRAEPHIEHASQILDNGVTAFLTADMACTYRPSKDLGLYGIVPCEEVDRDRQSSASGLLK